MTCTRIRGAIVCWSPFYRLPLSDGRRIYMEWHSYFGPTFFHDRAATRQHETWYNDPRIVEALNWFCRRGHKA